MATKSVATEGDVEATASSSTASTNLKNTTGSWTAGPVAYKTYAKLRVNGREVIYEASCTFSYAGTDNSSHAAVTDSESVTLGAGTTILEHGSTSVLVDGDSETGPNGNQLAVSTSNKLKTS